MSDDAGIQRRAAAKLVMKRSRVHLAFALAAVAASALTLAESVRLQHAQRIDAVVMSTSRAPPTAANATSSKLNASAADPLLSEARLARAVALSKVDYDGALAAYKTIIQADREDLRRIALYDLGNLHLRQAIQYGLADEAQSLPLIELAKQSFRDVLRRDPTDWDARYNLERALRLAPEDDEDPSEDTGPPDPNEHERSTIADPRMDLP
jgi:mxaK protein